MGAMHGECHAPSTIKTPPFVDSKTNMLIVASTRHEANFIIPNQFSIQLQWQSTVVVHVVSFLPHFCIIVIL